MTEGEKELIGRLVTVQGNRFIGIVVDSIKVELKMFVRVVSKDDCKWYMYLFFLNSATFLFEEEKREINAALELRRSNGRSS